MLPEDDSLYLYNLTLRPPSASLQSIAGHFSSQRKTQELVLSTTTGIEVHRPNDESGKLEKLSHQPAFANIQCIDKIRLSGTQKDLLVLTSDSGNLTVAEFQQSSYKFVPILQEPHSKSALRRINPGQYLAVEPKNRAIMISAIERNKLVYKVETDSQGNLSLSTPLEISSKGLLTLSLCALDSDYDYPIWAALEAEHAEEAVSSLSDKSSLSLNYYELDQGLNHIVRRKSKMSLPFSANLVVPMPGHIGGVLVCCRSYMVYEKGYGSSDRLIVPLPVRKDSSGTEIVCHFLHPLKKSDFFILLQSSLGDLFKLTVSESHHESLNISVTYFDTIPVCNCLNIFRSGFLFANSVNNDKLFYQFESLGEENHTTSRSLQWDVTSGELEAGSDSSSAFSHAKQFTPVGLQNLALVDVLDCLGPLMDGMFVETSTAESADPLKQLVTLSCHSYLKTLVYGVPVSELVTSPVPLTPSNIFTTKILRSSPSDQYLVLTSSLDEKSLVLSIGEVVEEVVDSRFITDQCTLVVQQVGKSSVVQVHRNGIRHIRHTVDEASGDITDKSHTDWYPPAGITILSATSNNEQIVVALSNREICYFEIDPSDDQLTEYQERFEVTGGSITAVAINSMPAKERKSFFLVIGCSDETIQLCSLAPHNCFEILTLQALSANCRSLLVLPSGSNALQVHIGMENGVYVRASIDPISGKLSDTRLKYLGTRPVELRSLRLPTLTEPGVLAISSRPWVGYFSYDTTFKIFPLLNSQITSGTSFFSEDIGVESVVGINKSNLTIFTLGNDDSSFNVNNEFVISSLKLRYTPKKLLRHTGSDHYFVIESDYNTKSPYGTDEPVDEDYYTAFGYEREEKSWASCLQVVDHAASEVIQTLEFENNECAVAMSSSSIQDNQYLFVSTTTDLTFPPTSSLANAVYTYLIGKGHDLELIHKTPLDGQATAIAHFSSDRIIIGIGNQIRMYEVGKKQLLRKSSSEVNFLRRINKIKHVGGDIILVGDAQNSLVYLQYDASSDNFIPFVNDMISRQITAFDVLDNRTVVAGDKFGNVFVSRVPQHVAEQVKDNVLMKFQEEYLCGSGFRLDNMCDFYLQDIPTSFSKGSFVVGGTESIIYTGLQGTVGLLLPLATKQEVQLLLRLETMMRDVLSVDFEGLKFVDRAASLVGREHLKFRSYYNPVKNIIDGDFLERFYELDQSTKIKIAHKLDRSPREIERKLYDLRNRAAF